MILARSKQILAEPEDRALLNCLTLSFSYIMIAFLLFYSFCGCPGLTRPSVIQDGTDLEPVLLTENMKWSDIVFNWFTGSSSAEKVKNEDTIVEDVAVEEKDEKSNSIRDWLQSYLAPVVEGEPRSPGLSSYFALAEEIKDDNRARETNEIKEIQGKVLMDF